MLYIFLHEKLKHTQVYYFYSAMDIHVYATTSSHVSLGIEKACFTVYDKCQGMRGSIPDLELPPTPLSLSRFPL